MRNSTAKQQVVMLHSANKVVMPYSDNNDFSTTNEPGKQPQCPMMMHENRALPEAKTQATTALVNGSKPWHVYDKNQG